MKHKILISFEIGFAILLILLGVNVFANQAGSSEDPLVAKSYVDDKINQMIESLNKVTGNTSVDDKDNFKFTPVSVNVGQSIFGKEGTEILLRSGKGKAIVPGAEGISNITNGKEIQNNNDIEKNNLLIIPREDGRGIKITENAWFLVKGKYEIK